MFTGIGIVLMVVMMGGMMLGGRKMMGGHKKPAQTEASASQAPVAVSSSPVQGVEAVYACSMGDYFGPLTKDGRCPKCGMALSLKK